MACISPKRAESTDKHAENTFNYSREQAATQDGEQATSYVLKNASKDVIKSIPKTLKTRDEHMIHVNESTHDKCTAEFRDPGQRRGANT